MKIINITFKKFDIALSEPFTYFTATLSYLPYILVIIKTDNGLIGFGEASIAWDITGETQKGSFGIFPFIKPLIIGKEINNLKNIYQIMEEINQYIYKNSAIKSGIEFALLDLLGKLKNLPVYALFGSQKKEFVVGQKVFTYNQKYSSDLQIKIQEALTNNAKIIKFKAGDNIEKELKLIQKIISWFPNIKLVFDVNQGWQNYKKAIIFIKKLEQFNKNIAWIEQPIKYSDYTGLSELTKKSSIKIMADESCHDIFDLENLYKRKAVHMVNIKLAKAGGIIPALKMVEFCKKHKIKYMLGDMISSMLGTATNLHMAVLGDFESYDLTQPNKIKKELFSSLNIIGHKFYIPSNIGLGVEPLI